MAAPDTSSAPLIISLFGPLQILVDGHPLPRLRSRKGIWLLALLTLRHGRPVEREWLAGTLWPDMDQSQAFANLRPVLSELRNGLDSQNERLTSPDRQTLLLNLEGADVDLIAFDAAVVSTKLSELEQAAALYRGHLLEGCTEEWVFQERSVREHQCLQALQTLAQTALTTGDYGKAVGYYQRAAVLDSWEDSIRRGWMEALAKNGDRNSAMQVYREFVVVLRNDPNAVPDEQTTALYARLRAEARTQNRSHAGIVAEPVVVPKVAGYLPHALTEIVGREDECLEVAARLRHSRLLTLTGLGGIGKTRLALKVARQVAGEYADGAWLVALESLSNGEQVLPQIASVLGIKEETGRPLLGSVTQSLQTRQLLLVLDNCEHLLEAGAQVAGQLLQECGELRILATSREALDITGETAWSVPTLAVPNPTHLPQGDATLLRVLSGYESVQLFVERAQAVQKSFELTRRNALAVAQVCFRLEGIPLALELAAARVKALTVEQIAARLDNELGLLVGGSRTALARQQTLRATLDWSYTLLTEAEQILLRRLSVFAGGWTLEAAESVCTGEMLEKSQILDILTTLVDKSLVLFEDREGEGGGRNRFLEMVRQYATERLQASGEEEAVYAKHRDWCIAVAEEAGRQMRGGEQEAALLRFTTEYDNLRASLQWNKPERDSSATGLRLAVAIWPFWSIRGYFSEGRMFLERMLAREQAKENTFERAWAMQRTSSLAESQGDYSAAHTLAEESLRIFRNIGDKRGIAFSLNNLADSAIEQGNYALAKAAYQESLALFEELEYKHGIAWSLTNLGSVAIEQGDYHLARTFIEESLSIRRETGEQNGVAFSLYKLGVVESSQGDPTAAKTLYEESLSISRKLGNQSDIAYCLSGLGDVAYAHGNYIVARLKHEESLLLFRGMTDRPGVAASLKGLAAVMLAHTAPEKAIRLWGAATALNESIGAPLPPIESQKHAHFADKAHSALGEEGYATALNQGRAMTWEQAVVYALSEG